MIIVPDGHMHHLEGIQSGHKARCEVQGLSEHAASRRGRSQIQVWTAMLCVRVCAQLGAGSACTRTSWVSRRWNETA